MNTMLFARDHVSRIARHVGLDTLMDEVIAGIEKACADTLDGAFEVPARAGFYYDTPRLGLLEWMPAMRVGERIVIKLVGYHPRNPEAVGVPTILSSIVVFDPASGHLGAVMDGTFLTSLRTGAASALATRWLKSRDARSVGLIGAGAQAVTQLHALSRVMPVDAVHIFDTDPATMRSFEHRIGMLNLNVPVTPGESVEGVVHCDVLCTTTSVDVGGGPVFPSSGLVEHVHINAVGSDFPGKTEVPRAVLKRALVCPDFAEQAMVEGECQQLTPSEVGPDLATLLASPDAAWRNRTTVFDSTGWALEDYVVAEVFARHGQALGEGTAVALESFADDPKDPYGFLDSMAEGVGPRLVRGQS